MTNAINDSEILEYLRAFPDVTISEIARALNIESRKILSAARKNGISSRFRRAEIMAGRGKVRALGEGTPKESRNSVGRQFGISASRVACAARERRARRIGTGLESEQKIVEYIKSHPKESYTAIGAQFGYLPGRLSKIAREYGIIRYAPKGQGEKKRRLILKYLRNHQDMQIADIAENLGVSIGYVARIANMHGLRRRAPNGSGLHIVGRVVRKNAARFIPRAPAALAPESVRRLPADHELDSEIQQREKELRQLRARKALREIRIEVDGDTISVYGVGAPITRLRSDWLRWLKASGAALLREKCNKLDRVS